LQSPAIREHAFLHVPRKQYGVALVLVGQSVPQVPQLAMSLPTFVSHPSAGSWLQSSKRNAQPPAPPVPVAPPVADVPPTEESPSEAPASAVAPPFPELPVPDARPPVLPDTPPVEVPPAAPVLPAEAPAPSPPEPPPLDETLPSPLDVLPPRECPESGTSKPLLPAPLDGALHAKAAPAEHTTAQE
jgi:hypothetical protein